MNVLYLWTKEKRTAAGYARHRRGEELPWALNYCASQPVSTVHGAITSSTLETVELGQPWRFWDRLERKQIQLLIYKKGVKFERTHRRPQPQPSRWACWAASTQRKVWKRNNNKSSISNQMRLQIGFGLLFHYFILLLVCWEGMSFRRPTSEQRPVTLGLNCYQNPNSQFLFYCQFSPCYQWVKGSNSLPPDTVSPVPNAAVICPSTAQLQ